MVLMMSQKPAMHNDKTPIARQRKVLNTAYPTEPDWYCLGFDRFDSEEQASVGPHLESILLFTGQDWLDEEGNVQTQVYDPSIGHWVAMDAADYYVRQGGRA